MSIMKNIKLTIVVVLIFNSILFAQNLAQNACYTVSNTGAETNVLFIFNPDLQAWNEVGATSKTNIEAIAVDVSTGIIYAADNGQFGTLDANTGLFSLISNSLGIATGALGNLGFNHIVGLTYDYINGEMYAVHRVEGVESGTNDLLFKIDAATGSFVPGAMIDPATGDQIDYVLIHEVFNNFLNKEVYNVNDIAYHAISGKLLAIQSEDGHGLITNLNLSTGEIEDVVFGSSIEGLEGLAFTHDGQLLATIGNQTTIPANQNALVFVDLTNQAIIPINKIDPTGVHTNFKSLDCFNKNVSFPTTLPTDPTTFQLKNAYQIAQEIIQGDSVIISILFDLAIDSLGLPMSADDLCFTIHSPSSYQNFEIKTVYAPLTLNELEINEAPGEFMVCIDRENSGNNKRQSQNESEEDIMPGASIIQFGVCIVVDDVPGKYIDIDSLYLSGYRNISSDLIFRLQSTNLLIGFDVNKGEDLENRLELALRLKHQDCDNLGSIEIEIQNNQISGIAPYTYSLIGITDNQYIKIEELNEASFTFDNLTEGVYELRVSDKSFIKVRKKFTIRFVAKINGSFCCIENLFIEPGNYIGEFDASNEVSVSAGTLITKGTISNACNN